MLDYRRSKSLSDRLNITLNVFLLQKSRYFLSEFQNTESSQNSFVKRKIKLSTEYQNVQETKLLEFKKRLINQRNSSNDIQKRKNSENVSLFRNKRLNQFLIVSQGSQDVSNEFEERSFLVQSNEKKREQIRNRYRRIFTKNKMKELEKRFEDQSLKYLQKQVKQRKSIMIIRKMNEIKEKIVLNKKEKFQQELYKHKQTPIHHSQSLNTKMAKKKWTDGKNKSKNKNRINDVLRVRETTTKNGREPLNKSSQNQAFELILKGEAKFDQNIIFKRNNQSLKISVQEYRKQKKQKKTVQKLIEKGTHEKRDEQIGPWIKAKNVDLQLQL